MNLQPIMDDCLKTAREGKNIAPNDPYVLVRVYRGGRCLVELTSEDQVDMTDLLKAVQTLMFALNGDCFALLTETLMVARKHSTLGLTAEEKEALKEQIISKHTNGQTVNEFMALMRNVQKDMEDLSAFELVRKVVKEGHYRGDAVTKIVHAVSVLIAGRGGDVMARMLPYTYNYTYDPARLTWDEELITAQEKSTPVDEGALPHFKKLVEMPTLQDSDLGRMLVRNFGSDKVDENMANAAKQVLAALGIRVTTFVGTEQPTETDVVRQFFGDLMGGKE